MTAIALHPWLMAARPKTLVATFAPIFMGGALAFSDGIFSPLNFSAALLSALFIQVGTNLANDYFDFKKGADTAERVGPQRVTQSGLVKPSHVFAGFAFCFAIAALFGLFLVADRGAIILVVGVLSIMSGIAYTAGPLPLAYVGLGELFVLVFFGPVASGFTYFVASGQLDFVAFLVGLCPGAISCAILIANNLRDVEQDRKCQKRTLAVRFGVRFAKWEYAAAWTTAFVVLCVAAFMRQKGTWVLPLAMMPLAIKLCVRTFHVSEAAELIKMLEQTAKGLAIFTTLFCIGVFL